MVFERYQGIYATLFGQMQRRVDWGGPVLEDVERERRGKVPKSDLVKRQQAERPDPSATAMSRSL